MRRFVAGKAEQIGDAIARQAARTRAERVGNGDRLHESPSCGDEMIDYDPKHWWGFVLAFRGTVWPAVIGRVLWIAGLTLALELVSRFWWSDMPQLNHQAHTWMGVVLGLMIVFRTNTAYERFWEGRRLWGGLVNASRNLVRGAAAHSPPANDLANLVVAYVRSVMLNLRGEKDLTSLRDFATAVTIEQAAGAGNPPSVFAYHLSTWINERARAGKRTDQMAMVLEGHLSVMVDNQGGCERILKTPIPFVYAIHLRHITIFYLLTLPSVLVPLMGWGAPLAVAVIAFGLLGIEEAGIEIEDPFGEDPNDLPLDDICAVIQRDALTLASLPKA